MRFSSGNHTAPYLATWQPLVSMWHPVPEPVQRQGTAKDYLEGKKLFIGEVPMAASYELKKMVCTGRNNENHSASNSDGKTWQIEIREMNFFQKQFITVVR